MAPDSRPQPMPRCVRACRQLALARRPVLPAVRKGLKEKVSGDHVAKFKRVPHLLFPESASPRPNRLAICIQPDEAIQLRLT